MLVSRRPARRAVLALALTVAAGALAAMALPHTAAAICKDPCTPGDPGGGITTHTLSIQMKGVGTVKHGTDVLCSLGSGRNTSVTNCTATADEGESVTLTATPASGYGFSGWSGGCSGSSCTVTMTADKSVTATFWDSTPPPAPTISSPSAGQVIRSDSPLRATFTLNGAEPQSAQCAIDSASATGCSSPWSMGSMSTGTHTLHVRSTDVNGNLIEVTRSFKYVNMPDTTLNGTPAAGAVVNTLHTDFSYESATGTSFECHLDGTVVLCNADLVSSLGDGPHTLTAAARIEPFGDDVFYLDPTPATRSWTIDTKAPDTTLSAGPSGATTERSASFAFGGTDPAPGTALHYMCRLDGGSWSACGGTQDYANLTAGSHTFDVEAVDLAGNVDPSPASRAWTVIADSDGDGFYSNTDCDDSNPAIHPGAVDIPGDGIDQDCSGADTPAPAPVAGGGAGGAAGVGGGGSDSVLASGPSSSGTVLAAKLSRSFKLKGARTLVRRLVLTHLPRGASVKVACKGRGCPFRSKSFRPKHGTASLTKAFRRGRLAKNAKLVITVRLRGAKTQHFTVLVRSHKKPRVKAA